MGSMFSGMGRCIQGVAASLLVFVLAGCGGGGGVGDTGGNNGFIGAPEAPVPAAGGAAQLATAKTLTMAITGVVINSPPVVIFTVNNQDGVGMNGLTAADLNFNIAKLVPVGANGDPSHWQNYINVAAGGAVQGAQEHLATGAAFGTLLNRGNGAYTYAFATNIKSAVCPAPCTDAAGKALDLTFQPNLTHRVTIQQANSAYPTASAVFDFVPGGAAGTAREIVLTSTCNQCHEQLTHHGTRVDTRLCVTCHNPGTWVAANAGTPNTTVDFKVMIHKIHYNNGGAALPSVISATNPTPYRIGSSDFSSVTFTQDVRNCTDCHDGALSAQGDNWKTQPSMEACGSCHDDVFFGVKPDPARLYQTLAHRGGVMTDNAACASCHTAGSVNNPEDIVVAHNFPARLRAAAAKFKLNIIGAAPTTPGSNPVITFSVTDPTNGDRPYDIKAETPFTAGANSTLNVNLGWTASGIADIGNDGSGQNYGPPVSINALTASVAGTIAGTYTVTSPVALRATQTGTLRVSMDGHPAGDVTTSGIFSDQLPVKSVFADFPITGSASARRLVVDIAKCDLCHGTLSLHGNNRTDEPGVCAVCHNPNATDANRRPRVAGVLTTGADGKSEEAIDFKTMIHAIHAGQVSNGGFRTKGIMIYRDDGSPHDFSKVVFPGKIKDCAACHLGASYQLSGIWGSPTANGILGTTFIGGPSASDPADNLRITPIAAVCSSCHDNAAAKAHMVAPASGANFFATQATINTIVEQCTSCHGPGGALDVQVVHGVR